MKLQRLTTPLLMAVALLAGAVQAQSTAPVAVEGAWARASVAGQKATGAFMRLTASQATRLVRVESAAAGVSEVHEMKVDGDIMKMRPVHALDLPANQVVELKPGGYHIMLMDLKAPLSQGTSVPLTLIFQDAQGAQSQQQLQVPVASQVPGVPAEHAAPHKQP